MLRTQITASAAGLLLVLAGCSDDAPADPATIGVVVSNATDAYGIPWLVGQNQGFFQNHGVTVNRLVTGKGGSTTLQTQLSGDLPIGEVSYPAVVQANAKKAPVVAVGGATHSTYSLDFYALASNPRVKTIRDIRTWAYTSQGSVSQALTYLLPQRAGVPETGAKRVATGGLGEGVALLESGGVDVAIISPSVVLANPSRFRLVVSSRDLIGPFQQTVITTTTSFLREHPAVVKAVLAGYADSVAWISSHIDQTAKVYTDFTHIPLPAATQIVKSAVAADNWGAGLDSVALENAGSALKIAAFKGSIDYCSLFDTSLLPAGQVARLPVQCPEGPK